VTLTQTEPSSKRPGLWRHILAMVYDMFLVAPLFMANAFVLVTLFGPTDDASRATVPSWLMQATSFVIVVLFFTLFWRKSGQTLGMQAWRIKLVDSNGQPPSIGQCVARCIVALISFAPLGLGFWWSLVDPSGLRWHDRATGTRLVLLPKRQK